MITLELLLCLAVVGRSVSGAASNASGTVVAEKCATSLLVTCYTDIDLELTWMDGVKEDPNMVMRAVLFTSLDPVVQCRKPEAYKEAAECLIGRLETCSQPAATVQRLPDITRMKEGMDLMCTKYIDTNAQCVKAQGQRVTDCTTDIINTLLQRLDPAVLASTSLICLSYDVNYDCLNAILTPACDSVTTGAYLENARWYSSPRVCNTPDTDPGRPNRIRHITPSLPAPSSATHTLPATLTVLMTSVSSACLLLLG